MPTVQWLVAHGAGFELPDHDGYNSLQLADRAEHSHIQRYLKESIQEAPDVKNNTPALNVAFDYHFLPKFVAMETLRRLETTKAYIRLATASEEARAANKLMAIEMPDRHVRFLCEQVCGSERKEFHKSHTRLP